MKRSPVTLPIVTLLFLTTLTVGAFADSLNITNKQGTVTVDQSGVSMFQSQLLRYNGQHGSQPMGYVTYTTGALLTGSVLGGGTFSSVGSTFQVVGQGQGIPNGVIFNGTFVGPITWTYLNGQYKLIGQIQGMMYTGRIVTGYTIQTLSLGSGGRWIGVSGISSTSRHPFTTPEPTSFWLFGTGVVAMGLMTMMKIGTFRRVAA
jgi:hypothetical protein